jgi:hypothetical protein
VKGIKFFLDEDVHGFERKAKPFVNLNFQKLDVFTFFQKPKG